VQIPDIRLNTTLHFLAFAMLIHTIPNVLSTKFKRLLHHPVRFQSTWPVTGVCHIFIGLRKLLLYLGSCIVMIVDILLFVYEEN
jgi:hypothetical protein